MSDLSDFVAKLSKANILHSVSENGSNAVVYIQVTGERWEVEFFPSAAPEIEIFRSTGEIEGEDALKRLFERFSDSRNF